MSAAAHEPTEVSTAEDGASTFEEVAERYHDFTARITEQIRHRIVGQDDVVRDTVICLLCGGHLLLEGVPGLGKTELLKSLAESVQASFGRIQFTPDLMPADVVGTEVVGADDEGNRTFRYREGPIFTHLLLADEINRATPKTQSALLEAMQERQVTVAGETRPLPDPFMVMATQNPIELEGTYPLPEAQLDRFLLKVLVPQPGPELLAHILHRTTGARPEPVDAVCGPAQLRWLTGITRQVPVAPHLVSYAALLITATQPESGNAPEVVQRYVRAGSSPRGGQAMILAAKARALLDGRPYVNGADLVVSATSTLRHRVLLGYEATADGVTADEIVAEVVSTVVEPGQDGRGIR
ncbi:MAG: AAA family ATPase [Actinomycetota bacterium]